MKLLGKLFFLLFSFANLFSATFYAEDSKGLHLKLKEATNNNEDDIIELADGYYNASDENIGTFTYKGIDGKNLTIKSKSNDYNKVVIRGNGSYRALSLESNKAVTFELKNISVTNGNTQLNGGGVYANQKLIITGSYFSSNLAKGSGGAIYGSEVWVYDSSFVFNQSGFGALPDQNQTNGGGAIYATKLTIHNSTISQNRADYGCGGAINATEIRSLNNKLFSNQTTGNYNGGAIYANKAILLNNFFYQNSSGKSGGALFSDSFVIVNSSFGSNSAGLNGYGIYGKGLIVNSYFNNASEDIYFTASSTLKNSYVDFPKLKNIENNASQTMQLQNNVQKKSTDNFLDANYQIIDSAAPIVNAGLNIDETVFKTDLEKELNSTDREYVYSNFYTDLAGNNRVSGGTIDIGVYEYGSTKYNFEPAISELNYSGTLKTGETITFSFVATAAKDRKIVSYHFDYGDGLFVPIEGNSTTKVFDSEKDYTVRVKVTDDKGSSALKSLTIKIAKSCVCEVCNYEQFDLNQSDVDTLGSGWHLLGSSKSINITTALPNATTIWVYKNGNWQMYKKGSSNSQISTIDAKRGFWYQK